MEKLQISNQQMMHSQQLRHMSSLLGFNSSRACHVSNVVVEGTEHLRDSFIVAHLQPMIQATNIRALIESVDAVNDTFKASGAVKAVIISLDSMQNQSTTINVVPKIKLVPVSRFMAKTGTNIGNGEGDGYITFQWRNIFGGGEHLVLDATTGTRTRSSYLLNYNTPLLESTQWRWDTAAYATSRKIDWSSHEQVLKGVKTKAVKHENGLAHELSLQAVLRSVRPYTEASSAMLAHAGDDLKVSLGYDLSMDTRDDKVLPTKGWFLGLQNELAGLTKFSTTHFIKQSLEASYAATFNERDILNLSLRSGWLYSMDQYSHIMDRFYLGGPNDVRSFFYNGLGARDTGDSLGGDVFISGGASAFTKFPFLSKESGLKLHSFVNFGSLVPWDHDESAKQLIKELCQPSVGCGFGIVFKHPVARFELNFVLPVVAHKHDAMRKGLQYGIGLQFM
jgi:outer membrane protein insertion porin family